jgi:hypothetical protein
MLRIQVSNSLILPFLYEFQLALPVIKTVVQVKIERRANVVAPVTRPRRAEKSREPGGIAPAEGQTDAGSEAEHRTHRGIDGQPARLS